MKKIFLGCAVALSTLLAGCNDPSPPAAAGLTTLSGKVVEGKMTDETALTTKAWSQGAGTIALKVEGNSLTTTPLAADGSFNFSSLPAPSSNSLVSGQAGYNQIGCTGNLKFSDPATKLALGDLVVTAPTLTVPASTNPMQVGKNTQKIWSLVYADRTSTITGSATCSIDGGRSFTVQANGTLAAGWNMGSMSTNFSANHDSSYSLVLATESLPSSQPWVASVDSGMPFGKIGPSLSKSLH